MKRISKIALVATFLFGTATLHSCKKCMECHYDVPHGNHTDPYHEDKCGNKKDLKKFEADMKAEAISKGSEAHCHEEH